MTFSGTFVQERPELTGSAAGSYEVRFIAHTSESYSLAGDFRSESGNTTFVAYLKDLTTMTDVFLYSQSVSDDAPVLLSFSNMGTLIAGHEYAWFVSADTGGESSSSFPTLVADGSAFVQIGNVPEPGSIAMWTAVALLGFATPRSRHRSN